ncbi:hypothetical protein [Granulosicoccus antarcticus]|uniref:hypothetical protein n=1 Tax=Granulosicoccus antarcticus TaxID=437505 RepID=UPI0012FD14DE|nr:hypothetical protein [Granulosicoccus antarcticus]
MSSVTASSVTLTTIKANNNNVGDNDPDTQGTSTVIASSSQQINSDTAVTTLIMTSTDSRLPNLSLEDVLNRSGIDDDAMVTLESEENDSEPSHNSVSMTQAETIKNGVEQIRNAIDSIEGSSSVVVEIETTNNVQTVTVRAADINTVYTQASAQTPGSPKTTQSNYLLLNNGWAYTKLQASPLDLPTGPSEQTSGDGWAIWRSLEDGVHEIQDAATGMWNRLTGLEVDISPKSPADVAGVLSFRTADVQISSKNTTTTSLQLSPEGVFTNTRSSLTTNGDLMPEVSFALHSISSAKGISNHFSAISQTAESQTAVVNNQQQLAEIAGDMFGAYRMLEDGMTLEMHFADGSVTRKLYLQIKDNPENLTINGQLYARQGNSAPDLLGDLMRMLTESGQSRGLEGQWLQGLTDAIRNSTERPPTPPVNEQHVANISSTEQKINSLPKIHV